MEDWEKDCYKFTAFWTIGFLLMIVICLLISRWCCDGVLPCECRTQTRQQENDYLGWFCILGEACKAKGHTEDHSGSERYVCVECKESFSKVGPHGHLFKFTLD